MKEEYVKYLKHRTANPDDFGYFECYCGHTDYCTCGDPNYTLFVESVERGTIDLNKIND